MAVPRLPSNAGSLPRASAFAERRASTLLPNNLKTQDLVALARQVRLGGRGRASVLGDGRLTRACPVHPGAPPAGRSAPAPAPLPLTQPWHTPSQTDSHGRRSQQLTRIAPIEDQNAREGWLSKRGGRTGIKGWDRRWCVYRDERLSYYVRHTDKKPQGKPVSISPSPRLFRPVPLVPLFWFLPLLAPTLFSSPSDFSYSAGEILLTSMVAVRWTPAASDSKHANRFELITHERVYYFRYHRSPPSVPCSPLRFSPRPDHNLTFASLS